MRTPRSLNDYLDAARAGAGLTSDRQLSLRLGHSAPRRINTWRKGWHLPEDDQMLLLARLARWDPDAALLDKLRWQAERDHQPETARMIDDWRRRLITAAACLLLLLATSLVGTSGAQSAPAASESVYYGKFSRWLRRHAPPHISLLFTRICAASLLRA